MKITTELSVVLLLAILAGGCAGLGPEPDPLANEKRFWNRTSTAEAAYGTNEIFDVRLVPNRAGISSLFHDYDSFTLVIKNKTTEEIEIDWNRSFFLENGQTSEGFMFEGQRFLDRDKPRQPDIVLPTAPFTKVVFPVARVQGRILHPILAEQSDSGDYGVYLTVKAGEKVLKQTVTTRFQANH
ncbi:MAG: hypothetical protein O2960_28490 [Verrucomicrobia bacterium]|nr:hypothetical protein [Verrucomicrobiota bacterium]